jgi:hypothetical protein
VGVQYINGDWSLEKRIIGLRLVDVLHSSQNITDRIVFFVVEEFSLTRNIFIYHTLTMPLLTLKQ